MKKSALALSALSLLTYFGLDQKEAILGFADQLALKEQLFSAIAAIITIVSASYYLFTKFIQENKSKSEYNIKPDNNELSTDSKYERTIIDKSIIIDKDKSPYRGLEAFNQKTSHLFYGRQREVKEALSYIGKPVNGLPDSPYCYWLQIQGNSGAGKSSLVKAGLLPKIEANKLHLQTGIKHWKVIEPMLPSGQPLKQLAAVLERSFVVDKNERVTEQREARLRNDDHALCNMLKEQNDGNTAFVLVVDQFEELFTFADKTERKQFDALLANALNDDDCPLCLITTVRLDFLGHFEKLPALSEMHNQYCKPYLLKTISKQGLIEAIDCPAEQYKLDVSDVKAAILRDAEGEDSVLPLVENALQVLWQNRQGDKLSGEFYEDKGGLVGLLEEQADALLAAIDRKIPNGKQQALDLLLALTRSNTEGINTRRRISLGEALLNASGGKKDKANGQKIIDILTGLTAIDQGRNKQGQLRLIATIGDDKEQQSIDLIHELLVRQRGKDAKNQPYGYWKTLYSYIAKNKARGFYRDQLEQHAKRWKQGSPLLQWWHLAPWRELKNYRKIPVEAGSNEQRYRAWSMRWIWLRGLLLLGVLGMFGESGWWVIKHQNDGMGFPPSYAWKKILWETHLSTPLPKMIKVPKGSFTMGCVDGRDNVEGLDKCGEGESYENYKAELPAHKVTIAYDFKLSETEITFEQYDYYVWDQKQQGKEIEYPKNAGFGRGQRPVIKVSWGDGNAYANWLKEKTGKNYRLPSEAEWEYAARAGEESAYSWGNRLGENKLNCNNSTCKDEYDNTAPVASFEPNQFGLYDMHGNVWEWVQDGYHENYQGAATDGSVWSAKAGSYRVLRGGSWLYDGKLVRSAIRNDDSPGSRSSSVGLRLAIGQSSDSLPKEKR